MLQGLFVLSQVVRCITQFVNDLRNTSRYVVQYFVIFGNLAVLKPPNSAPCVLHYFIYKDGI